MIKFLIGGAITILGVGAAIIFAKKNGKKDSENQDPSFIEKIEKAALKKALKILTFVAVHSEQIEAASTLVGLVGGIIGIGSAIKEYKRSDELKEQLDRIEKTQDKLGHYVDHCANFLNGNLKVIDGDLIKVADKLGVQILKEGEVL